MPKMCPQCGCALDEKVPAAFIKAVIDDLVSVSGRKFRYTDSAGRLIRARKRDGYELEDFKAVHRLLMKWVEAGTFSLRYVRPATIYSPSKFEGYVEDCDSDTNNVTNMVRKAMEKR